VQAVAMTTADIDGMTRAVVSCVTARSIGFTWTNVFEILSSMRVRFEVAHRC
jgi:hypothetical protein